MSELLVVSRTTVIITLTLSLLLMVGTVFILHNIHGYVNASELTRNFHISEACLQCICQAGSGCKALTHKNGEMCRHFRISQSYWIDVGLPSLEGDASNIVDFDMAYLRCINNPYCAARTVSSYVGKHLRDCNEDGLIGCYDFAAIHINGHMDCSEQDLEPLAAARLHRCLVEFSVNDTVEVVLDSFYSFLFL